MQTGEPLIKLMMLAGRRIHEKISLHDIRKRTLAGYTRLSEQMSTLEPAPAYPVRISKALHVLADQLDAEMAEKN